jgi:uncharacterized protein YbjT (DUF2867 family)
MRGPIVDPVLVTGATGLIGGTAGRLLAGQGMAVSRAQA